MRRLHNSAAMQALTTDAFVSYVVASTATVIALAVFGLWTLYKRVRAAEAETQLAHGLNVHLQSELDAKRTELRRDRAALVSSEDERDNLRAELRHIRAQHADEREWLKYTRDCALDALGEDRIAHGDHRVHDH